MGPVRPSNNTSLIEANQRSSGGTNNCPVRRRTIVPLRNRQLSCWETNNCRLAKQTIVLLGDNELSYFETSKCLAWETNSCPLRKQLQAIVLFEDKQMSCTTTTHPNKLIVILLKLNVFLFKLASKI